MQDPLRAWRHSTIQLHRALCNCNDPVNCLAKGCTTEDGGDPSTGGDSKDEDLIALLEGLEKESKEDAENGLNTPEGIPR